MASELKESETPKTKKEFKKMTRQKDWSIMVAVHHFKCHSVTHKINISKIQRRNIVAVASRRHVRHISTPTPGMNGPHKSPPGLNLVFGFILASAGASTAFRHVNSPKYVHYTPNSHTTSQIITIQKPAEYSSLATFPSCDIGTLGGLVPSNWGVPYKGKNPAIALAMASAGVTIRMIINVTIIYLIKKYWMD